MVQTDTQRQLPDITESGLFFIVVLSRSDGKIEIVTCEEKAKARIKSTPAQYTGWHYVLVE